MYRKDFDGWNEKKKTLDTAKPKVFPKEREVWVCSYGINVGNEQNGTSQNYERPVLVLKKFNNQMVWGILLSLPSKKRWISISVLLTQTVWVYQSSLLR